MRSPENRTKNKQRTYCTSVRALVQSSLEKHALGVHNGIAASQAATRAEPVRDGTVGHEVAVDGGEDGSAIRCGHICGCYGSSAGLWFATGALSASIVSNGSSGPVSSSYISRVNPCILMEDVRAPTPMCLWKCLESFWMTRLYGKCCVSFLQGYMRTR